jgi:hypothetical protein
LAAAIIELAVSGSLSLRAQGYCGINKKQGGQFLPALFAFGV